MNIGKIARKIWFKRFFEIIRTKQIFHKRTWELPLSVNNFKGFRNQIKNETLDFSSVDESEVVFEPNFETSSQYTTRFQQSIEKHDRELNLSSITSNDERTNTDRVLNFTRSRHPEKLISIKSSYDYSDSSIDFKPKVIKISKLNFGKCKNYGQNFGKVLTLLIFIVEKHIKNIGFNKIHEYAMLVVKKRSHQGIQKSKFSESFKKVDYFRKFGNIFQEKMYRIMMINKAHIEPLLKKILKS